MKLLKIFGAFLLTGILIFGFILGWNWNSFKIFIENREAFSEGSEWVPKTTSLKGLSEFMGENPEYVSLTSNVVNHPDSVISYMEHKPRVMGATANFFILAAYAVEFEHSLKTPDSKIHWDEISKYKLNHFEDQVHSDVKSAAVERGLLEDGLISLDHALKLLAEFNDLALADFLWWNLKPETWNSLAQSLNLNETDLPLPYTGLYLAISPGIQQQETNAIISNWINAESEAWRNHVINLSEKYLHDDMYRSETDQYLNKNRLGNTFIEERNAMILFPKSTSSEFARVLGDMVQNQMINPVISTTVKEWLRWPYQYQSEIKTDFVDYGALYDNRIGLMNGINFGTSTYTGDTTVQAMFFDQLPLGFWFHASGGHMNQDFIQRLIYDPALIDQVHNVVNQ